MRINRVRLLVSRRLTWRAGGLVQRYLHRKLLREFLASHFVGAREEFVFHGATVSREVLALRPWRYSGFAQFERR